MFRPTQLEKLPTDDPSRASGVLFRQALATRSMLEHVWDAETAFQGITLQETDVASRGQCGVTSLWMARQLAKQGVDAWLTEGTIHLADGRADEHVWVEVRDIAEEALVVDLTSDQYQLCTGAPVHVGVYEPSCNIGNYTPETYLPPDDVPRRKLMARYALLEQKITQLPRRKQIRIAS